MRYLIFIKGDGRGHITQALALSSLLKSQGHEIVSLVVGCPESARLPDFLFERAPAPVVRIISPNFVLDRHKKNVNWAGTAFQVVRNFPALLGSINVIDRLIKELHPDVLINLFEPMLSLYTLRRHPSQPIIGISHQAMLLHSRFDFPPGRPSGKTSVQNYTRLVRAGCTKSLALSFYDFPDDLDHRIYPVAPLLRPEVMERTTTDDGFYLVYMVAEGLESDVRAFHARHPEIPIRAFSNRKDGPDELVVSPTLTFFRLNDVKFLNSMASCRGMATTAGFESVCEAMYYGKPAILMPAGGQYEQYVNAYDAGKVGAGRMVDSLDLTLLEKFIPEYSPKHDEYLAWLQTGRDKLIHHLENPR